MSDESIINCIEFRLSSLFTLNKSAKLHEIATLIKEIIDSTKFENNNNNNNCNNYLIQQCNLCKFKTNPISIEHINNIDIEMDSGSNSITSTHVEILMKFIDEQKLNAIFIPPPWNTNQYEQKSMINCISSNNIQNILKKYYKKNVKLPHDFAQQVEAAIICKRTKTNCKYKIIDTGSKIGQFKVKYIMKHNICNIIHKYNLIYFRYNIYLM